MKDTGIVITIEKLHFLFKFSLFLNTILYHQFQNVCVYSRTEYTVIRSFAKIATEYTLRRRNVN